MTIAVWLSVSESKASARTSCFLILSCIAVAGALYLGREFFVPIVFAFLLHAIFRPLVRIMERARVPAWVSGALVVIGVCVFLICVGYLLAAPLQDWIHKAP